MANALVHNADTLDPFIGYNVGVEEPLVLQLGGCEGTMLAQAAKLAEEYGTFDEINLNCGCPSNKAKKAGFGAELMLDAHGTALLLYDMQRQVTRTNITVKCRLGVSPGMEAYSELCDFILAIKSVGVNKVILHSRLCMLRGLTPAQNRTIPPLQYDTAYQLISDFPDVRFVINGGIDSLEKAQQHLEEGKCDGVMIGRSAYNNPFLLAHADEMFAAGRPLITSRRSVLEAYLDYADDCQSKGVYGSNTCNIVKPLHNFFYGSGEGNRLFKRKLDELLVTKKKETGFSITITDLILEAMEDTIPTSFLDDPLQRE